LHVSVKNFFKKKRFFLRRSSHTLLMKKERNSQDINNICTAPAQRGNGVLMCLYLVGVTGKMALPGGERQEEWRACGVQGGASQRKPVRFQQNKGVSSLLVCKVCKN
jgi:hypothetical protein